MYCTVLYCTVPLTERLSDMVLSFNVLVQKLVFHRWIIFKRQALLFVLGKNLTFFRLEGKSLFRVMAMEIHVKFIFCFFFDVCKFIQKRKVHVLPKDTQNMNTEKKFNLHTLEFIFKYLIASRIWREKRFVGGGQGCLIIFFT